MNHHNLKILPEYYNAIDSGRKTFEVRFNDRNYQVDDILHLQEWVDGQYTGRKLEAEVTYLLASRPLNLFKTMNKITSPFPSMRKEGR